VQASGSEERVGAGLLDGRLGQRQTRLLRPMRRNAPTYLKERRHRRTAVAFHHLLHLYILRTPSGGAIANTAAAWSGLSGLVRSGWLGLDIQGSVSNYALTGSNEQAANNLWLSVGGQTSRTLATCPSSFTPRLRYRVPAKCRERRAISVNVNECPSKVQCCWPNDPWITCTTQRECALANSSHHDLCAALMPCLPSLPPPAVVVADVARTNSVRKK
jgi:hypothetical protein